MKIKNYLDKVIAYVFLVAWVLIVFFPLWTMIVNSFKTQHEIFTDPFSLPKVFTLEGYKNALEMGNFGVFFLNSLFITVVSLSLILLFGSLAAYALVRWKCRLSNALYFFFIIGMMIPIRLGTMSVVKIIISLGLNNKTYGLIPIYVASGIPVSILVLTAFIRSLPKGLIDAASIDGASEITIFWKIILPLIRPALSTVAIFNMIPIWNDFWWPLILLRQESVRTVPLGVSLLFGEFSANWTNILSVLTLASIPMIILYLLMSKQFIRGLTAGAMKG
ncbi:carbohydrate ABC transporter membrane protein 2, CUT1 family [Longilinea arvoryzae]|uniref:Carbohydrate ABC transporter membrane protein 2, CUT1 family n=1 Tax=Longilinea arvoryzae TaxID=360412 RepID=A0A0S7BJ97_9CHLR|nr:carbohydrate ABC transporter permease [Longilinea arvoryzae]GAP13861.1 carbohydrate ABC transporter membrane protein 2, CUT1 family [Longilinea arvoryzae]